MSPLQKSTLFVTTLILISLVPIPLCIVSFNWAGEDCFITYRYAENLAEGHGLVFNAISANADERVQGYSNLLLTLILAISHALGGSVIFTSRWLSSVSIGAAAILLGFIQRSAFRENASHPRHLLAPLLLVIQPMVILNANRGLETTFHMALIMLAGLFWMKRRPIATAVAVSVLVISRPEGLMWAVPFLGAWILSAMIVENRWKAWQSVPLRTTLTCALIWSLTVAVLFIWQRLNYGQWLPNSVVAKVTPCESSSSIMRVFFFIKAWNFVPAIIPFAFFGFSQFPPAVRRLLILSVCVIGWQVLFVICVGDVPTFEHRFFIPVVPFFCLLIAVAFHQIISHQVSRITLVYATVLLMAFNFYIATGEDGPRGRPHIRLREVVRQQGGGFVNPITQFRERWDWYHGDPIRINAQVGMWVNDNLPPDALISGDQMGQTAYYAQQPMLVMDALLNETIAREGFTTDQFFNANPTHALFHWWVPNGTYLSYQETLLKSDRFNSQYRHRWTLRQDLGDLEHIQFHIFVNRDSDDSLPLEDVILPATADDISRLWRI